MKETDLLSALQRLLEGRKGLIRVKVTHESEPTDWSSWIIRPAEGYFEVDKYGPFLLRETEWFEIKPLSFDDQVVHELNSPRLEINNEGNVIRLYPR
jgi:hypothetical protein